MEDNINYLSWDLNIFPRTVSLYYKGKTKLSSKFSSILSFIYIILTIFLFIFELSIILNRQNLVFYDSIIFPDNAYSFELNKSNLNFIFAVEDSNTNINFIDETVYYPKIIYYKTEKNESNEWITTNKTYLQPIKCSSDNFDESNYDLFKSPNLNNSYCINNYNNVSLKGGFKYNEFDYIKIKIYPCKNSSSNNNHCKTKEYIEEKLGSTFVSINSIDIGLTPNNFSYPTKTGKLDLYTSIGKTLNIDYILNYRIVEIKTDTGLFLSNIETKTYLQFENDKSTFSLREQKYFDEGSAMISIHIRLSDKVQLQKRLYDKLSKLFTEVGGYMQLFSTIFCLLSLLSNRFYLEKNIVNDLFRFEQKTTKIFLKTQRNIYLIKDEKKKKEKLNLNKMKNFNLYENNDEKPDSKKIKTTLNKSLIPNYNLSYTNLNKFKEKSKDDSYNNQLLSKDQHKRKSSISLVKQYSSNKKSLSTPDIKFYEFLITIFMKKSENENNNIKFFSKACKEIKIGFDIVNLFSSLKKIEDNLYQINNNTFDKNSLFV